MSKSKGFLREEDAGGGRRIGLEGSRESRQTAKSIGRQDSSRKQGAAGSRSRKHTVELPAPWRISSPPRRNKGKELTSGFQAGPCQARSLAADP